MIGITEVDEEHQVRGNDIFDRQYFNGQSKDRNDDEDYSPKYD